MWRQGTGALQLVAVVILLGFPVVATTAISVADYPISNVTQEYLSFTIDSSDFAHWSELNVR